MLMRAPSVAKLFVFKATKFPEAAILLEEYGGLGYLRQPAALEGLELLHVFRQNNHAYIRLLSLDLDRNILAQGEAGKAQIVEDALRASAVVAVKTLNRRSGRLRAGRDKVYAEVRGIFR